MFHWILCLCVFSTHTSIHPCMHAYMHIYWSFELVSTDMFIEYLFIYIHVCVKHLKRCKTSKLLFFDFVFGGVTTLLLLHFKLPGGRGDLQSSAQQSSLQASQEADWSSVCTGKVVITCSGSVSNSFRCRHGNRLSPEPARRFVFHFFIALLSQSVNLGAIWLCWMGRVGFQFIHSALAIAMVAVWYFVGSFHRPIPVRCDWNVFRTQDAFHSKIRNDSSEQVCDSCWIRHGGMNPSGNTFLGRTFDPSTWSPNLQFST